MAWVASRYAVRSVGRNLRRTVLSIVGIAIGCVLALFMESLNRGEGEMFARARRDERRGPPARRAGRLARAARLATASRRLAGRPGGGAGAARTSRWRRRAHARQVLLAHGHARRAGRTGRRRSRRRAARRSASCDDVAQGRYLRAGDNGARRGRPGDRRAAVGAASTTRCWRRRSGESGDIAERDVPHRRHRQHRQRRRSTPRSARSPLADLERL